jgi:hypothetical protein
MTMIRYALTNTSDWLFPTDPLYAANAKDNIETNTNIMNILFKSEDRLKVRRLCFDQCVNDFNNTSVSVSEASCLRSCTNDAEKILTDLSFSTDMI